MSCLFFDQLPDDLKVFISLSLEDKDWVNMRLASKEIDSLISYQETERYCKMYRNHIEKYEKGMIEEAVYLDNFELDSLCSMKLIKLIHNGDLPFKDKDVYDAVSLAIETHKTEIAIWLVKRHKYLFADRHIGDNVYSSLDRHYLEAIDSNNLEFVKWVYENNGSANLKQPHEMIRIDNTNVKMMIWLMENVSEMSFNNILLDRTGILAIRNFTG